MNSIRKFQKKKLKQDREWQRGGFRAHPFVLQMRQYSSNNRSRTSGRIAVIHENKRMDESGGFGWFNKIRQKLRLNSFNPMKSK